MNLKPLIIGNWKMSLSYNDTSELVSGLLKGVKQYEESVGVIVAPSMPFLDSVSKLLKGSEIGLASQNIFWEPQGAYTGEVSAPIIAHLGCQYVILGHSERRKYLRETDQMVHRKLIHTLEYSLTPIICIGETFEQRKQGIKELVVMQQLQTILGGIMPTEQQQIVIAYEPIWAVGTGQACDLAEARETIQALRHSLIDLYQENVAKKNFRVVYGGSIDDTTVANYVDGEVIEGVLVGGASTKLDSFVGMVSATAK